MLEHENAKNDSFSTISSYLFLLLIQILVKAVTPV